VTSSPLLSVEHASKRYAGVPVLRDVSLQADSGEIVAVVGENGAGKSTLMRILAGVIPSGEYEGEIRLGGVVHQFRGVRDAEEAGIVIIPQELAVVPEMTVAENLFRNREPGRFGLIDVPRMRAEAARILSEFGIDAAPDAKMRGLGIARQQLVEIAKALSKAARIVILDEPTAPLTLTEADRLFGRLRELRSRNHLCLYISHRLDEVLGLADRTIVLRDGALAGERSKAEATHDEIVRLMLGRSAGDIFPKARRTPGRDALRVDHLVVTDPVIESRRLVDDVSLAVRAGEIVGIFGLVGAGRTELAMSLFGKPPGPMAGRIVVDGVDVKLGSTRNAIRAGIALVTEDRKRFGLVPDMGVRSNLSLAGLSTVARHGLIEPQREAALAGSVAKQLSIRARSLEMPARRLSGGNQQKVVLGKWLVTEPRVLILDEPTRGVDVGAKGEIYRQLEQLAENGFAVLLISSELPEVIGMCDRILVMAKGRIVGERASSEATEDQLLWLATGGR
jgi:D-xylose transport system ATP-binding protein